MLSGADAVAVGNLTEKVLLVHFRPHSTSTSVKQHRELLSLCSLKHFQFRSWFSPLLYVSDCPEHSPFAAKSTILVLCLKNVFFKCLRC